MTLQDFFNSKECIAIHCDTKEKMIKLLKAFRLAQRKWSGGEKYTKSYYGRFKELTCYDNEGDFDKIGTYIAFKIKVVEFDDIEDFKPLKIANQSQPTALNTRQWKTYNLIKENTLQGKWTSKKDIIDNFKFNPETNINGYIKNDRKHDLCAGVWEDIDTINNCPEIEKIIISDGKNNFKLASNQLEAFEYVEKFKNKAIKALVRYANLKRKIKADGQGKLLSNRNNPIDDESRAREFIETFIYEKK